MRKVAIASVLFVSSSLFLAGCLKDKDYEDQKYGLQVNVSTKGISLSESVGGNITVALNSVTTPQTFGTTVTLESSSPAPSDIKVNLTVSAAPGFDALPAGAINVPATVVIPAGQRQATINITAPNASLLDPTKAYGFKLNIASVDAGYQIASNLKSAVFAINIKNKYDGKYTLKGQFYHPTPANQRNFTFSVEMHTSGVNSVKMYDPVYFEDYIHPWITGTSVTGFQLQSPEYTIDPVTNKVTVQNVAAGATTFYTMAPGYNSHYDPATKTIYAKWGYNYAAGPTFDPTANREWTDTLIYVGPR